MKTLEQLRGEFAIRRFGKEFRLFKHYNSFIDMISNMPDECEDPAGYGQVLRDIFVQLNGTEPGLIAKKYGLI